MPPAQNKLLLMQEFLIVLEELPRHLGKVGLPRVIPSWSYDGSRGATAPQYLELCGAAPRRGGEPQKTKLQAVLESLLPVFEARRAREARTILGASFALEPYSEAAATTTTARGRRRRRGAGMAQRAR